MSHSVYHTSYHVYIRYLLASRRLQAGSGFYVAHPHAKYVAADHHRGINLRTVERCDLSARSASARQGTPLEDFFSILLEVEPKGCSTGVVRRAVGAVQGGVGAASHYAGIEDQSLIEEIQADRELG